MQIKRTAGRPSTTQGVTKAYNETSSIAAPKYKDLCTMREKLIISREHRAYYRAVKNDGVRDALPEPDNYESEEEFTSVHCCNLKDTPELQGLCSRCHRIHHSINQVLVDYTAPHPLHVLSWLIFITVNEPADTSLPARFRLSTATGLGPLPHTLSWRLKLRSLGHFCKYGTPQLHLKNELGSLGLGRSTASLSCGSSLGQETVDAAGFAAGSVVGGFAGSGGSVAGSSVGFGPPPFTFCGQSQTLSSSLNTRPPGHLCRIVASSSCGSSAGQETAGTAGFSVVSGVGGFVDAGLGGSVGAGLGGSVGAGLGGSVGAGLGGSVGAGLGGSVDAGLGGSVGAGLGGSVGAGLGGSVDAGLGGSVGAGLGGSVGAGLGGSVDAGLGGSVGAGLGGSVGAGVGASVGSDSSVGFDSPPFTFCGQSQTLSLSLNTRPPGHLCRIVASSSCGSSAGQETVGTAGFSVDSGVGGFVDAGLGGSVGAGVLRADEGEARRVWSSAGMQGLGETGDPRENPLNSGTIRHDSHVVVEEKSLGAALLDGQTVVALVELGAVVGVPQDGDQVVGAFLQGTREDRVVWDDTHLAISALGRCQGARRQQCCHYTWQQHITFSCTRIH
ncbi:hypothetical protein PR048_029278 [Dryococelus australis]|uniref:Uncharacterized protein n=1 Tax=Dryococelus australis TaxID=614101 RepID=A0ABQ9GDK7_9NEOP|nr:hypothetical protein PR048_029278 [Dryococelus australis]